MVKVHVGAFEKDVADVDQQWLCGQINGRRKDGGSACVRVHISDDEVDLALSTPGCGHGGGGGRPLRGREVAIVELWRKLHLNESDFSCGNVHAFLVQLGHLL